MSKPEIRVIDGKTYIIYIRPANRADFLCWYVKERLPLELCDIIYEYIPKHTLATLSRSLYQKFHPLIRAQIMKYQLENYIRDIVRRDYEYVFDYILQENCKRWISIKKYRYKSTVFANYLYFLQDYCIENESTRCRIVLNNFLQNLGLSKNQHKKNIIINKRWTN
jgi:hypothetical protein